MAIDPTQIETIYQLSHDQKWSIRKIARHLHLARKTIRKYLDAPLAVRMVRLRTSKLDAFKPVIRELIEQDPQASAVVIAQRLVPLGYAGRQSILRQYLRTLRQSRPPVRAYVRVESSPGDRFEIDWGHFGVLDYGSDKRKLYAFACVECHSRRLYLEFTHSQCLETFLRCHVHAFRFMNGVARECWYDNLLTAVAERDGQIIRFNPRFLAFAREQDFYPRACHQAAAWEKGKVERVGMRYVRQNFWPLRRFTDLADVNRQARQWLQEVANRRVHSETREIPDERFRPDALRPLPSVEADYRDSAQPRVHKDIRLRFDGNRYCVPPRFVGCQLTVRADSYSVVIYDHQREIVRYPRCWQRGQTLGAERFEKELLDHRPAAQRSQGQQRLVALMGQTAESYLRGIADSDRSLGRQIQELLQLVRQYGPEVVAAALVRAQTVGAFGADYIANILLQQQTPRNLQPPLRLKDPQLNELATDPLSLLDYDAFILTDRSES